MITHVQTTRGSVTAKFTLKQDRHGITPWTIAYIFCHGWSHKYTVWFCPTNQSDKPQCAQKKYISSIQKHPMGLKYSEKVQISRQQEIEECRRVIYEILENSKQLAMECDNLVKLRALKTRCDKLAKPRTGPGYDDRQKLYFKQRYQATKEATRDRLQNKRQKIREIGRDDGTCVA